MTTTEHCESNLSFPVFSNYDLCQTIFITFLEVLSTCLVSSSDNIAESYLVENWRCQERSKSNYRIFPWIIFPETSTFKSVAYTATISIGHRVNF